MKPSIPRLAPSAVLAFLPVLVFARAASAEVMIKEIRWRLPEVQASKSVKNVMKKPVYHETESWPQPPAAALTAKPRAVVTLINRGPNRADAVVLRYVVAARLVKVGEPSGAAIWTVPFCLDERRIPWLRPNQLKEEPIDNMLLSTYLKKTFRAGYWPNAIKIQVVVEQRPGESLHEPVEKVLPVAWKTEVRR